MSRPQTKRIASGYRLGFIALLVAGCFVGIGVRLVDLHVWNREELASHADRVRRAITIEPARRGDILDSRGDVLATSRTLIALGVDPQALRPADEAKWPQLARMIDLPMDELVRIFTTKERAAGQAVEAGEVDILAPRLIRWAKLHDAMRSVVGARVDLAWATTIIGKGADQ
jgi:cell division protein FtsI/penicillin-binding protein 2